jgi:two-component system OmpR family sensor kinase
MTGRPSRRSLRSLPLRARLVAGFALAMAVVLAASGAFLYWRVAFALDRRLDSDLADNAATVRAVLGPDGTLADVGALGTTPALSDFQVLRPDGSVVSAGPGLGPTSLLTGADLAAARAGTTTLDVGSMLPVSARPLRLRAEPVGAFVLVVGVRRDARDEALRELVAQLAVVGLGTLVVSTFVGERLAKAALRPVDRYRNRAGEIADGTVGVRLEVPPERDDELTRLGHTLNAMLDSLERASTRERRFLQDASHELRTPLTLLRTRTQLALSRPRTVAEHEQTLVELDVDLRELSSLASQLLQLEAGEGGPSASGGTAADNLSAVLVDLHRHTSEPPVDGLPPGWTLALPAEEPYVAMPAARLRQIATNLLSNAAVHGRPPVSVDVRVAEHEGGRVVVLAVTDAGDAMDADFLPAAAERFSRTDQARSRPGAGLGLSLVLDLVEREGGELRLCVEGHHHRYQRRLDVACAHPEAGTTASVLLPAAAGPGSAGPRSS